MALKNCLCLFLVLLPFIAYYTLKTIYAPLSGTFESSSSYGKTTIIFDSEYGIPYVTGSTNEAVFYGQGLVHASDKLYEMHLKRCLGAGRLSEVLGGSK